MAKRTDIKRVMIIGSGPIVIGQAAEFDYAGTQACLALKEEGYEVKNPPLYDRLHLSGSEVRRRILAGENWQELVSDSTIEVMEEIRGVERLKNLSVKEISDL